MMPIYFNAPSHLWIIALFFVNGYLLTCLIRHWSKPFYKLTHPFEAQVLSSFFISIGINGVILLALDNLSLSFDNARWPLIALSLVLTLAFCYMLFRRKAYTSVGFQIDLLRCAIYLFVFVVLFFNGGLIEQVSDAWWHMSLANKIAIESTYTPSFGHLTSSPTRYYPPLWHANLALFSKLSGISIPVLWTSFTAWAGVMKVMAFYLLALGFSRDNRLATLAAILFVLLPGVGTSYLRVSAWPSHIAYTAWYAMFYVFALLLSDIPEENKGLQSSISRIFSVSAANLFIVIALSTIIYFTHKAELLWFALALLSYLIAASLSRLLSTRQEYIADRDDYLLRYLYRCLLVILAAYSAWVAIKQDYPMGLLSDQFLVYILPVMLAIILFCLDFKFSSKTISYCLLLILIVLILGSIDYRHLGSLFVPEFALPRGEFHERASLSIGYFGGELKAPSWYLQLRGGLLYTGVLSIVVAVIGLALKPTRLSILTAGSGCMVIILCSSPYLYHWLQSVLDYHSPWRVSIMLFHPIVWASLMLSLGRFLVAQRVKS